MRFLYISPFGAFGLSHFGPFVPLARVLRERGHEVAFVSLETPPALVKLGFECFTQAELGLPNEGLDGVSAERYLDGSLDRAFRELPADRFVVDGAVGFLCLYLAQLERASVRFQITLPMDDRPLGWSPLDETRQLHASGLVSSLRSRWQWMRRGWSRRSMASRIALSRKLRGDASRWISPLDLHRRLAVAAGFDSSIVHHRGPRPGFRWPEIVACDADFALGFAASDWRHFAGNLVMDWGSDGSDFDWQRLREGAPLVYCSFGSNSGAWRGLGVFLRLLAETCRRMPTWDFVFAGAERWRTELGESMPPNLTAVEFAPQVDLLARSSVFVTHGGMSSVREARNQGVATWVLPIAYDQFGNAARLERLGWAARGDLDSLPEPDGFERILLRLGAQGRVPRRRLDELESRSRRSLESTVYLLEGPWSSVDLSSPGWS